MNLQRIFGATGAAAVAAVLTLPQPTQAAATAVAMEDVQLTGCVVRDEGGDGFLVTNMPRVVAGQTVAAAPVEPGPVGTSGSATIFYWLDDDDELEEHVGHLVAIRGEIEGDVKEGEITVERQASWTEIKVESGGRDLKARVPHTVFVVPASRGGDEKLNVLVRKVDAKDVTMIAASCER